LVDVVVSLGLPQMECQLSESSCKLPRYGVARILIFSSASTSDSYTKPRLPDFLSIVYPIVLFGLSSASFTSGVSFTLSHIGLGTSIILQPTDQLFVTRNFERVRTGLSERSY
jgi:hypothetical protein